MPRVRAVPYAVEKQFADILQEVRKETPELSSTQVHHCEDADIDHERNERWYAHAGHYPNLICVADAMGLLPPENIRGILWHEMGHIADFSGYDGGTGYDEADADVLALELWGVEIDYDEDDIQIVP